VVVDLAQSLLALIATTKVVVIDQSEAFSANRKSKRAPAEADAPALSGHWIVSRTHKEGEVVCRTSHDYRGMLAEGHHQTVLNKPAKSVFGAIAGIPALRLIEGPD